MQAMWNMVVAFGNLIVIIIEGAKTGLSQVLEIKKKSPAFQYDFTSLMFIERRVLLVCWYYGRGSSDIHLPRHTI